jgi:hypothetical protein
MAIASIVILSQSGAAGAAGATPGGQVAPTAPSAGALDFIHWLAAHPEVTIATVVRTSGVTRVRWSDASTSTVCAEFRGRSACVRYPVAIRHTWTLSTYRRKNGGQTLAVAIGPLPGDPRHAAAFEFRFPESTVHARKLLALPAETETPALPGWAANLMSFGVARHTVSAAPESAPALPLVPAPAWINEPRFEVFTSGAADQNLEPLRIEQEGEVTLCVRRSSGWHCFPTLHAPSLEETELPMPPHDRRLRDYPPSPLRAQVLCASEADCTILVEWDWIREEIARTCRLMGHVGHPPQCCVRSPSCSPWPSSHRHVPYGIPPRFLSLSRATPRESALHGIASTAGEAKSVSDVVGTASR